MPQLWLTYDEMAKAFDCSADGARDAAMTHGWRRKLSSDGETRVLMPPALMQHVFAEAAKWAPPRHDEYASRALAAIAPRGLRAPFGRIGAAPLREFVAA